MNSWMQNFDGAILALSTKFGLVDLSDSTDSDRLRIEFNKDIIDTLMEIGFENLFCMMEGMRSNAALQTREFAANIIAKNITPGTCPLS